ncbi:hypothetical protein V1511DRAFT_493928 [Dipodascopsis uninucleata]
MVLSVANLNETKPETETTLKFVSNENGLKNDTTLSKANVGKSILKTSQGPAIDKAQNVLKVSEKKLEIANSLDTTLSRIATDHKIDEKVMEDISNQVHCESNFDIYLINVSRLILFSISISLLIGNFWKGRSIANLLSSTKMDVKSSIISTAPKLDFKLDMRTVSNSPLFYNSTRNQKIMSIIQAILDNIEIEGYIAFASLIFKYTTYMSIIVFSLCVSSAATILVMRIGLSFVNLSLRMLRNGLE